MGNERDGPLLSDEEFFLRCIDKEDERMHEVRALALTKDYAKARKTFAAVIRKILDIERFFTIPYEIPENVYKYSAESDENACRRIGNHIMISVGEAFDFGKDDSVNWMANPTANHYEEWTWQLNRHHELKLLAHQYHIHPDPQYAETAAELFTSWVRQATAPGHISGYDTDCWRTIECGIRMGASWPYTMFAFCHAPAFTDDVITDWFKSVWEQTDRLYTCRTKGNWLIMEMNGLAQTAILYPWFQQSGQWLSSALTSLSEELDRQIYQDGFQYELSTNYHETVLNNYQRMLEVAEAFRIPVPETMLKKLEKACEVYIKLMMPDGSLPDLNDGRRSDVKSLMRIRSRILPNAPCIKWMLEGRPALSAPEYESIFFPWSGLFIMRNGWTPESTWALFDGGPFGRAHQHEDKLSLLLYAQGKLLLTEGGNYAYDDSKMRRYVLSSRAHNTILVDGHGQNRRDNYIWREEDIKKKANLRCQTGKSFDYGESTYHEGYGENAENIAIHNRSVYFIKTPAGGLNPYLIVVDRLKADEIRSYEAMWHVDSCLEQGNCHSGRMAFSQLDICVSDAVTTLTVACGAEEPEWQGFVSTGMGQGQYRAVPCVLASFAGTAIRTVTVISPHREEKRIMKVAASPEWDNTRIEIELNNGETIYYDENMMKMEDYYNE